MHLHRTVIQEVFTSVSTCLGEAESPALGWCPEHRGTPCTLSCPGHPIPPQEPVQGHPVPPPSAGEVPAPAWSPRGLAAAPGTGVMGVSPAGILPWCILLLIPSKDEITK